MDCVEAKIDVDCVHCGTNTYCAVNTMHQLSLLCPLMGKKPNLGTADAGAAVAWSDTDVAGRLYHDWPLNLQSACLCCVCSCLATVSCELDLHDELSNESLLRA